MTDAVAALRATIEGERIWQFLAVGALGALCDYAVLIALVELTTTAPELAKVAGAEASILLMFAVNERWTFADWGGEGGRALVRRLVRSNLVRAGGIVVAVAVFSALIRAFDVNYLLANAAGIGAGFVVNFVAESLFTWRVHQ